MKRILAALFCMMGMLHADGQGTAFTYQGLLNSLGTPANGSYDLTFQLFNAVTNGSGVGPILTNTATAVSNGLFTVTLDFGSGVFTGSNYWVEISARTNGGPSFTTLASRLPVTPAPYAIFATSAAALNGPVSNSSLSGIYTNLVTFSNAGNSFAGNGASLSNVNAAAVGGIAATNLWLLNGNAGTTPGPQFLGTTDTNTLELEVDGTRALLLEPTTNNLPNVIGGAPNNAVATGVYGATMGGGDNNTIHSGAYESAIGGGTQNSIKPGAYQSTIAGGTFNLIDSNANNSFIGGGSVVIIQSNAAYSTIGGGVYNTIGSNSSNSTIAGGSGNSIGQSNAYATVGGGAVNNNNGAGSVIGGGGYDGANFGGNLINGANAAVIAGGISNVIQTNGYQSTIAGGGQNTIQSNANNATISGGNLNTIQTNANNAMIAGGGDNSIQYGASSSTISGGSVNTIQSNSTYCVIAGGNLNTIQSNAPWAAIGGGDNNQIQTGSAYATIGGGLLNAIQDDATNSTIGGGFDNAIQPNATNSTIAGGELNTIQSNAGFSFIGGGKANTIQASALYATIPGGANNLAAGSYSLAAGHQAQATNQGAFVWADSQNAAFASTNNDSFNVRAQGGAVFTDGNGNSISWTPGSGSSFSSDRNLKDRFAPVDEQSILEKVSRLPLAEWSYKGHGQRHIGAMAQDFHALFPLNENDKVLNEVDLHGVELAAIKGLNKKVEEQAAELQAKDAEIQALEQRLERLETKMSRTPAP